MRSRSPRLHSEKALREQLALFLQGDQAHLSLADAVRGFPVKDMNLKPPNVPYTFWHLLEHIRIAQWDIVDFIKNPDYTRLEWPKDYWPATNAKATKKDWDSTLATIKRDLQEMIAIVRNPNTDLHAKIPHGDGQTILREAILIVDHSAYHIGEFAILRQVVKNWS